MLTYFKKKLWQYRILQVPLELVPVGLRSIYEVGLKNSLHVGLARPMDIEGRILERGALHESIEFVLPWKYLLTRDLSRRGAYELMADFSVWLIGYFRDQGLIVIPIVNFDDWMSLPARRSRRRVSWHTRGLKQGHLHLKVGVFPEFVSIDDCGFGGWSSFSKEPVSQLPHIENERLHFEKLKQFVVGGRISKYSQPEVLLKTDFGGDYLFFPMQVHTDVVAKLAWIDTVNLLKILAEYAPRSVRKIVVKRHPKCRSKKVTNLINNFEGIPNLYFSDGNIHDLIGGANAVVTVNSGVGAEALLHRKPVIVTGESDYMAATIQVRESKKLIETLSAPVISPPEIDFDRFIMNYCSNYMVKLGDRNSLAKHPILHKFISQ